MTNGVIPYKTIGILGDGQLGQMTAQAARKLAIKTAVIGPGGFNSPAGSVVDWAKAWESDGTVSDALLDTFCGLVDVVLVEWENVPVSLVQRIEARGIMVCPNSKVLAIAQDRFYEKRFAQKHDVPVPYFGNVETAADLQSICGPAVATILKTRRDGYDGKGQVRIPAGASKLAAWETLGKVPCVLEEHLHFACEISVIVAYVEGENPQYAVYGPFENIHRDGILRMTRYPIHNAQLLPMAEGVAQRARELGLRLASALHFTGLLAVEFFVTRAGQVLFNEMAPRPHNSGHLTIECCQTSQFEQYVRAACGFPLGPTTFKSGGVMVNLIGSEVDDARSHEQKGAFVHLYGKEVRENRKMGHVTYEESKE